MCLPPEDWQVSGLAGSALSMLMLFKARHEPCELLQPLEVGTDAYRSLDLPAAR